MSKSKKAKKSIQQIKQQVANDLNITAGNDASIAATSGKVSPTQPQKKEK